MKITFKNFKQHIDREFVLPDKGLVLVDGKSGVGKTTLLKGIQQALFDSVKKPYTFGTKTCSVLLEMNKLTVYRQKGPNRLIVNNVLEDASAQNTIHSVLGMTEAEFMASSYIQQKMQSSLLTLAPVEQLAFIEKLAFGENSPDKIRDKISELIAKRKLDISECVNKIDFYNQTIEQQKIELMKSKENLIEEKNYEPGYIQEITQTCNLYKEKKEKSLELIRKLNLEKSDQRYEKIKQLNEAEKHYISAKKIEEERISGINHELDAIGKTWPQESQIEAEEKLSQYQAYPNLLELKEEVIRHSNKIEQYKKESKEIEDSIQRQLEELEELPTTMDIRDEIAKLEKLSNWIVLRDQLVKEANELFNSIPDFMITIPELKGIEKLTAIKNHFLHKIENLKQENIKLTNSKEDLKASYTILKQADKKIKCPNCKTDLIYVNGELKTQVEDIFESLSAMRSKISSYENNINSNVETIQFLEKQYSITCDLISRTKIIMKKPEGKYNTLKDCVDAIVEYEETIKQIKQTDDQRMELLNRKSLANRDILIKRTEEEIEIKTKKIKNILDSYPTLETWSKHIDKDFCKKQIADLKFYIEINKEIESKIETLSKQIETESKTLTKARTEFHLLKEQVAPFLLSLRPIEEIEKEINEQHLIVSNMTELLNGMKNEIEEINIHTQNLKHNEIISDQIKRIENTIKEWEEKKQAVETEEKQAQLKLEAALKLKQYSETSQMEAVASVVESINIAAKDFLDLLFPEDPCVVSLLPYKQTKDCTFKSKFSTIIKYKGCEYNDIDEISGGEYDRIVLAYQLALNSIYNSPVLMLDEAFTAVEEELFILAMDALKIIAQEKLILVVSHGANHGIFDEIIEV